MTRVEKTKSGRTQTWFIYMEEWNMMEDRGTGGVIDDIM